MFGKQNIIQFHHLENSLITLSPNDFPFIDITYLRSKYLDFCLLYGNYIYQNIDTYMLFLLSLVLHILFLYIPFMPPDNL
jgi:hypothetical protein